MTGPLGPLSLSGELSLDVDGVGVQVHAEGGDLRVVADDVGRFVARLREAATARSGVAPGRRDLRGLAAALAGHGVTAYLQSPTRTVAVAGAGVDSAAGGLLLGTRLVQPRAAAVVLAARRGRSLLLVAAAVAALVALLGRRRR
ncbi:hypothetical protein [Blastococcus sp. SYSU D00695]